MNEQKTAPVLSASERLAIRNRCLLNGQLLEDRFLDEFEQALLARVGAVGDQAVKPLFATVMVDNSGEQQVYCLMAAWRRKADALAALDSVGSALKCTPAAAVPVNESVCKGSMSLGSGCGTCARCLAETASAAAVADALPIELQGVADTVADGGGFWRSCSGCHELNEGVDTGPISDALGCNLGNGCSECGGIGAVWDTTDYQAMADSMAASISDAPQPSSNPGRLTAIALSDKDRLEYLEQRLEAAIQQIDVAIAARKENRNG